MKKLIVCLLVCIIGIASLLCCYSEAALSDLLPSDSVWGLSRDDFLKSTGDESAYKKCKVGSSIALRLSGIHYRDYTLDGYYVFAEKVGTHYGLSKITYLLSGKKHSSSKLTDFYNQLIDDMTEVAGEPDSTAKSVTKWEKQRYTIDIGKGKFKNYNNSDETNVAVVIKHIKNNVSEASQKVKVTQGLWTVGKDIPEGHWNIEATPGNMANITVGTQLDEFNKSVQYSSERYYHAQVISETYSNYKPDRDVSSIDVELKNGDYIEIEYGSVIFTPFKGNKSFGFSTPQATSNPTDQYNIQTNSKSSYDLAEYIVLSIAMINSNINEENNTSYEFSVRDVEYIDGYESYTITSENFGTVVVKSKEENNEIIYISFKYNFERDEQLDNYLHKCLPMFAIAADSELDMWDAVSIINACQKESVYKNGWNYIIYVDKALCFDISREKIR